MFDEYPDTFLSVVET